MNCKPNTKRKPKHDDDNGFAEHGGYMTAKIAKLEEQFSTIQAAVKQKSNIFEGVSIFVNGYTKPSSEELKRIMLEHSGRKSGFSLQNI
jgi:DNA repair protein REV1